MAYASVPQLRQYLGNVEDTPEVDSTLGNILERATSIVESALGFSFSGYTASTKKVRGDCTSYLKLPPHKTGTISAIEVDAYDVDADDYFESEGGKYLILEDGIWHNVRYEVTAQWGYGAPPPRIVEVVLEVAVNIWRSKEAARFSNVVFASDGGQAGYEGALTNQQKMIVAKERERFERVPV